MYRGYKHMMKPVYFLLYGNLVCRSDRLGPFTHLNHSTLK